MPSPTLKPCPYCGETPIIITTETVDRGILKAISCNNWACDIQPQTYLLSTLEEAVAAWNRRAGEEAKE